ncbi:MAG: alpha/beta fold hydrolase [Pseudonocardia sediminis]
MSVLPDTVPIRSRRRPRAGHASTADRRVVVDGVGTQYLESGTGPVLVLLHGHEQDADSWRSIMPAMAWTHRVIAVSLPGHGESDPAVAGYSPGRDLGPFVAAFLDTLGIDRIDLVGHSAGGIVALNLALSDPARVRSLTLVDSGGLGHGVNPLIALDTLPVFGELAIALSRLPGGNVVRTLMAATMLFARPWRIPVGFLVAQYASGRRAGQLESSTAMARALFSHHGQREVLLDRLHTLTMPTLVVWGLWDLVLPAYQAQMAVDRLPRGRLALFLDCGHLPHVEEPDRFVSELRAVTG